MLLVFAAAAAVSIPLGLDLYLPVPEDNPLTEASIEQGRQLFFDKRLSRDGSVSCATCHDPARAFSDGRPVAVGVFGRKGHRNSPALVNRVYGRSFFWDGRIPTLEQQVLKPIEDPNEMDLSLDKAASRVRLSTREMSHALSSFIRSLLSGDSPYDRFLNGDTSALTPAQQNGLRIFRGKGNCTSCHIGPNLTDEQLHNTGIAWRDGRLLDEGAGQGRFRTPTLREIALTAPYMHDGSLATLEDVIEYYDRGGNANPYLDVEIRRLHLTAGEKRDIAEFLGTLIGAQPSGKGKHGGYSSCESCLFNPGDFAPSHGLVDIEANARLRCFAGSEVPQVASGCRDSNGLARDKSRLLQLYMKLPWARTSELCRGIRSEGFDITAREALPEARSIGDHGTTDSTTPRPRW